MENLLDFFLGRALTRSSPGWSRVGRLLGRRLRRRAVLDGPPGCALANAGRLLPCRRSSPPQEDVGFFFPLIEKVRSYPALSQAALMAGVRLAQVLVRGRLSLNSSATRCKWVADPAYQMMKGNERAQEMQDQKFAADQAREGAVTEGIAAWE